MRRSLLILMFVLTVALSARAALAAHVEFNVQPRSAYVGMPIELTFTISDATNPSPPELPEIDGFTQMGPPAQSSNSMSIIINGRQMGNSGITYTYRLVPQRVGTLTIPSLSFEIDGQQVTTEEVQIKVQEATNDGLMTAEVISPVDSVYVGAPIELTLRITIKAYRESTYRITLSDQNMWSLLGVSDSQWGVFQPVIQDMENSRRRPPARTIRSNSDGEVRYQYDIKQMVYPENAGNIDIKNVMIVLQYPVELRRDFFGNIGVDRSRPVTAAPSAPNVVVKPLPEQGKPKLFAGAVGSFTIGVDVKPTDVAVGDPITVSLTVTDVSKEGAQLEVLKPPALYEVGALTKDFRVHEEPLAGTVEDRRKTFTQTIRALNENVKAVPPIPFVYFDPQRAQYVTLQSDPIPIHVRPASTMALSEIVQANGVKPRSTELTPVAGGILANFDDPSALLANDSLRPSWWLIVLLALPPVMFVLVAIGHMRAVRLSNDPALVRQRRALKHANDALSQAEHANEASAAANLVASAIAGFVADRCNLPPGAVTRADVSTSLAQRSVDSVLAQEATSILERCEQSAYMGAAAGSTNGLIREAHDVIARLHKASWS